MTALLVAVPVAPLAAAVLCAWLGPRLRDRGAWLPVAGVAVSLAMLGLLGGRDLTASVVWFTVGAFELTVGVRLDALSRFAAVLVSAVALLVNFYAVGYMAHEAGRPRFHASMALFAGAMLALVLADSLLLLFAAWELVGVASWLLIGFRWREDAAQRAALKAFLLTRIGDFGFLLAWLTLWLAVRTTDLDAVFAALDAGLIGSGAVTLVALLLLAAAVGKSAQLPLTAWLPDAMVGPTPVSALIHSATMVAAGVYLLLRLEPVFAASAFALEVMLWIGAATALVAALVATAQHDVKRLLAWSTSSQLGEMMMAVGLGAPAAAAFHLTTHAVFKSCLFLCAGAIERVGGTRDVRQFGGVARRRPAVAGAFVVAAAALAGVPPFAGFWSEEEILAAAQPRPAWAALVLLVIFLAGAYIGRAAAALFAPGGREAAAGERPGPLMLAPIGLLALAALTLGFFLKPAIELLPLGGGESLGGSWRAAAVLASGAGLALGAWRVRRAGPVPVFGRWPEAFAAAVNGVAIAPRLAAALGASAFASIERLMDRTATSIGRRVMAAARTEAGAEATFDRWARSAGDQSMRLALGTDHAERHGFSPALDSLAFGLNRSGAALRQLQAGKVYLYTAALFAWVLLGGLLALVLV